jgi:hypothetical protein
LWTSEVRVIAMRGDREGEMAGETDAEKIALVEMAGPVGKISEEPAAAVAHIEAEVAGRPAGVIVGTRDEAKSSPFYQLATRQLLLSFP